ncbi:MAG: acyltransferase domain-containing protein [Dysgonamonadaceae bacterium]|jgi:polyketide-type polyunsaturated fatty acid synthase PfaA|nr:acyltransferase domain-containing protein [Dysgonamonadaceae bacterium]
MEKEFLVVECTIQLTSKFDNIGVFEVLQLGKSNDNVKELITTIAKKTKHPFGLYVTSSTVINFELPENVTKIVMPFGYELQTVTQAEILYQISSLKEAKEAIKQKVSSIIIKESENEKETVFDIFRKVIRQAQKSKIKVYIQGGVGVHTSAAFLALGAKGIIFDSQSETITENYKTLKKFANTFYEAAYGHLHQAKNQQIINFDEVSETDESEKERNRLSFWEEQINKMLKKEKNFSKFSLTFSDAQCDAFFAAFVSIMAAPVAAKGIKIKLSSSNQQLQTDTQKLLTELPNISPYFPSAKPLDIAVVGMECIYPGAANVNEYWKNILLGKDSITEIPASHWNKELYNPETTDTDYTKSKWGGFIPDTDFDPVEFGIVPHSAFMTEPLQLLGLTVVKKALKDAGYENLAECDFENTSIIMGVNGSSNPLVTDLNTRFTLKRILGEVPEELEDLLPKANEYSFPGILPNVLSGRIANRFNFGGKNYAVDGACASSLATLDIACQELVNGRTDMVVLGGSDFTNGYPPYIMFSSMGVLSPDGRCAAFDASGNGIVLSEGIGVLILKRLEDAEREGNKIYAVIKGIDGSSDGRNMSVTAPNRKGEQRALERAYHGAGILPSQVGLIEAHGTGTVVGDKMELVVLTDLFLESGALPKQTYIGSVKSQIGHTKCAAGVAGLIKAILSVYHKVIPPTIHLEKPNTYYDAKTSPFVFNKRAGVWNSNKRIAGVSAFGFGGTNFHAILENYSENAAEATVFNSFPSELFVFRGDNLNEAKALMQKVTTLLQMNDSLPLADVAYSLALHSDKKIQVSIVAESTTELLSKINAVVNDKIEFKIYHRNENEGKVAFLFSGQGSQYLNMARDLFVAFPQMRDLLEKHDKYLSILFPESEFEIKASEAQKKLLMHTDIAQPLLGIVDLAIAEYLRFLGIVPDMVGGHSYGELPALCFSGVFSPDDLVVLSEARAKAIHDALGDEKGKLVAFFGSEEDAKPLLENEKELWIANYNAPKQLIIAGTAQSIQSFMQKATEKRIICREINIEYAFHSPLLNDAEKLFEEALQGFDFEKPAIPVWSNETAKVYPQEAENIKTHLAKHLVAPIKFMQQIENMYNDGARIFIETGPGRVALGLVESTLGKQAVTIQTDNKSAEGVSFLIKALAQYLSLGKEFHIEKLFEGRKVSLHNIDEPELYKKPVTGWVINGSKAIPGKDNVLAKK